MEKEKNNYGLTYTFHIRELVDEKTYELIKEALKQKKEGEKDAN